MYENYINFSVYSEFRDYPYHKKIQANSTEIGRRNDRWIPEHNEGNSQIWVESTETSWRLWESDRNKNKVFKLGNF